MPPLPILIIGILLLCIIFMWAYKKKHPLPYTIQNQNSFWQKLQTIFIEDGETGLWSSNRVSFIFTMFLSNVIMWGAILYLVIIDSAFPVIPESIIAIYGISNGVASLAKVWQKREERFAEEIGNKKFNDDKEKTG